MRRFVAILHLIAFAALLAVLGFVNEWLPFSGAGDDSDYFRIAHFAADWVDAFNPDLFSSYMAQPGFVMFLNMFNLAFAPDLLCFKVLNLTLFFLLVHVWTRIVAEIEGAKVARRFALCCVALTPMWFYFFFLLKDMLIALLLAGFVLGAVSSWKNPRSPYGWVLQLAAVVAVIPFRAPLAAQALVVMVVAITVRSVGKGAMRYKAATIMSGAVLVAVVAVLATNSEVFNIFGVASETRMLGSQEMMDRAKLLSQESSVNRLLFPVIYIFTEVSAFNAISWHELDAAWLRGILAVPWILLGVPALLLGVMGLIKSASHKGVAMRSTTRILQTRMLSTPWVVVVAFIAASALISWVVGDTTRWRIADMPALLAVAISATCTFSRQKLIVITALWCLCVASLFSLAALIGSR